MQSVLTTTRTFLKRTMGLSRGGGGVNGSGGFLGLQMISPLQQQQRSVHSKTQLRRLFKKHPARQRVMERLGTLPNVVTPPPSQPVYPPIVKEHTILSNGWIPPPPSNIDIPTYPFTVSRTKNKPKDAVGFLPVYSHMRKDGSLTTTRIRKVTGDQQIFIQELRAVLQIPTPTNPKDDAIRIRSSGNCIEIKGNHVRKVRTWLAGLGF